MRGEASDTDGAAAPDDTAEWNDTWAGEVSAEEQARARALLGQALAGGHDTTVAVEEWARARSRPGRPERRVGSRGGRIGEADAASDDDAVGRQDDDGSQAGGSDRLSRADAGGVDGFDGTDTHDGTDGHDGSDRATGRRRRGRRRGRGGGRDAVADPGAEPTSGTRPRERRSGPAQIDPDADPEAAARAICLRQLTGQPRTRAQLADALKRRGVPDDVAEHVLGRFTEVKLIDDAAFAAAWVDTRHVGRGLARRALARELRQRGVDPDLVHEAVERLDPEQELATARALVARRLPSTRRLDRQVRMRRLAGMLARKGYGEGLALRVVREALDADEDDDAWHGEGLAGSGDYDDDPPPEPEP